MQHPSTTGGSRSSSACICSAFLAAALEERRAIVDARKVISCHHTSGVEVIKAPIVKTYASMCKFGCTTSHER